MLEPQWSKEACLWRSGEGSEQQWKPEQGEEGVLVEDGVRGSTLTGATAQAGQVGYSHREQGTD